MTQEEKAKAYDKALAHAKLLLKITGNATLGNLVLKNEFEKMFPELKESKESDARIRKAIGYAIGQSTHSDGTLINGVSSEEAFAWLENKCKQKSADKL